MQSIPFTPDWTRLPSVRKIVDACEVANIDMCFAGGCVRDALMGRVPYDFDIYISALPETALSALQQAGIDARLAVPKFGLIRTNLEGYSFDIMSFPVRTTIDTSKSFIEQVKTYIGDYYDFSINALIFSFPDRLYDEFNGAADLKAGCIRFFGEPEKIVEQHSDHSILRFFRLHAFYGKGPIDEESLAACIALNEKVRQISPLIAGREICRLMEAPAAFPMADLMRQHRILDYACSMVMKNCDSLRALEKTEALANRQTSSDTRLLALLMGASMSPEKAVAQGGKWWQLPHAQVESLKQLLNYFAHIDKDMSPEVRKEWIEMAGDSAFKDMVQLRWSLEDDIESAASSYRKLL